jgi:hypothetical protein
MRTRLAGFAHTLRGAGFAIGRAEVQDAAKILATPWPIAPSGCARHCGRCSRRAIRISRGSTNCSTRSGVDAAPSGRRRSLRKVWLRARRANSRPAPERAISPAARPKQPTRRRPKAPWARAAGAKAGPPRKRRFRLATLESSTLKRTAPAPWPWPNVLREACGRVSPAANAPARAAGGSTCARSCGAASRMGASRSS